MSRCKLGNVYSDGSREKRQKHKIFKTKPGTFRKMQLRFSGVNRTYLSAIPGPSISAGGEGLEIYFSHPYLCGPNNPVCFCFRSLNLNTIERLIYVQIKRSKRNAQFHGKRISRNQFRNQVVYPTKYCGTIEPRIKKLRYSICVTKSLSVTGI